MNENKSWFNKLKNRLSRGKKVQIETTPVRKNRAVLNDGARSADEFDQKQVKVVKK